MTPDEADQVRDEYIRRVVDAAPPLTREQSERFRALLRPTRRPERAAITQQPSAGIADPGSAVILASRERGLSTAGVTLLSHSTNAVYLLPEVPAVARITTGPDVSDRVTRTQAVTAWLDSLGFGATAPLPSVDVVDVDERTTVSFWTYYPQTADQPTNLPADSAGDQEPASAYLGRLLRALHDVDHLTDRNGTALPVELPVWTPLESLAGTVTDPGQSPVLADADRAWLLDQIREIRDELATTTWPLGHGLIHGDAWAGNLLRDVASNRMVLGDWDWVSYGPREIDLIPTWHATIRYGRPPEWTQAFVDHYGFSLTESPAYDVLLRMRDLVQLTGPIRRALYSPAAAGRLEQRLGDLRRGDRYSSWSAR